MTTSTATLVFMAALIAMAALTPGRAEAAPAGSIAEIRMAASGLTLTDQTRTVCRRVWRRGIYRCGWRRVCAWRPGR